MGRSTSTGRNRPAFDPSCEDFVMIKLTLIAAASLAVLAQPASARTAHVQFKDLDLASSIGRATLDRRIAAAARSVCDVRGERELARLMASKSCYETALASTRTQVATLIARARRAA
jgi:UrcA family protein